MTTWDDYKQEAKAVSEEERKHLEEIEMVADIVSAIIQYRDEMGLSQRELAKRCGIPQSSLARIETLKTVPRLDTVIKIMQPLGLKLTAVPQS